MSTLEGAVPLGLGITKLRLWDELHRAHCENMHLTSQASPSLSTQGGLCIDFATGIASSQPSSGNPKSPCLSQLGLFSSGRQDPAHAPSPAKKRRKTHPEPSPQANIPEQAGGSGSQVGLTGYHDHSTPFSDWFLWNDRGVGSSSIDDVNSTSSIMTGTMTDSQGVLMPPPPPKPGPSCRKPPPLVARIKAKARRAKRKQQKAEHRRRLFLAHLVQVTREARQRSARSALASSSSTRAAKRGRTATASNSAVRITKTKMAQQAIQQAWLLFPECLGVDLGSFVETVFDTDAQSSEITAPSDISDDDLAKATKTEIENRKRLGGADVQVPKGVFRWMVARDFAQRWPQKVQHVRDNPWPGLEHVWGSPSGVVLQEGAEKNKDDEKRREDEEPFRWQSGRRSRFIRKEGTTSMGRTVQEESAGRHTVAACISGLQNGSAELETAPAGLVRTDGLDHLQARQAAGQSRAFPAMDVARPKDAGSEFTTMQTPAAANWKQRQDSLDHFSLTFEPTSDSWIRTGANSCSHAASFPSDAAGVPIRL